MTDAKASPTVSTPELRRRIAARLVGRERELDLLLAAVAAGRDLLLEGPPGTSKSSLLGAITAEWGIPLLFVEGNADLTPARIVGHHNPARVLREDYCEDNFVAGPLVEAMRKGGFLYVEELNRAPEDTLNTLLTAMAERRICIPRVGTVQALPTFRIVASMNPYDNVGTTRLSASVHDRLCRLSLGYQDAAAERDIVRLRTAIDSPRVLADAVALTRATRVHPDISQGSSVRGAIDLALVARELAGMRGVALPHAPQIEPPRDLPEDYRELVHDAMMVALSGRIHLDPTVEATPEQVLHRIWEDHFLLLPAAAGGSGEGAGGGGLPGDSPIHRVRKAQADAAQSFRPRPKQLSEEPLVFRPCEDGQGGTMLVGGRRRPTAPGAGGELPPLPCASGATEEQGETLALADATTAEGAEGAATRRRAHQIAARLALRRPRRDPRARRGTGELASLRYRGGSDEIDLDRTLEVLAGKPLLEDDDIVVRERLHTRRSVVLLVDVSGSMIGERVRTAAATVGALSAELVRDELAVVAFWSDAAVLVRFGEPVTAAGVLTTVLRVPARGLTNVHFALATAASLLRSHGRAARSRDSRVLLLSDCVHNAGPDPLGATRSLPRLDVLLDTSGENDVDLARDLARRGRGRLRTIRTYRDVAPALGVIYGS